MLTTIFHKRFFRFVCLTAVIGFILPAIAMFPVPQDSGKVDRIVIDAGHGGNDPGNLGTGRYKSKEKHISLDVALMVGNYVKQNFPDVEVVYTRDSDKHVGLKERAAMANRAKADLFMSIHCNWASAKSAYGTETFVMGLTREKANLEVAKKENSVIFLEEDYEKKYEGYDPNDPQAAMVAAYTSNEFLNQSAELAQHIQDQFRDRVHRRDRGVKQSVLYVLDFSAMPSVLIELGFLSNKKEEDFLNTKNGKELMASAIYRAFKEYKIQRDEIDKLNNDPAPDTEIADHITPDESEQQPTQTPAAVIIPEQANVSNNEDKNPIYKIQLATSSKNLPLQPYNFGGLTNVEMYEEYKLYKYTWGSFKSREEATKSLPAVKAKGFKDAFVVAFLNGRRIE